MDKNYWYDKYAPKKHSKGYWEGRYKNTILRDQDYYLEHYVNNSKSEFQTGEKERFLYLVKLPIGRTDYIFNCTIHFLNYKIQIKKVRASIPLPFLL